VLLAFTPAHLLKQGFFGGFLIFPYQDLGFKAIVPHKKPWLCGTIDLQPSEPNNIGFELKTVWIGLHKLFV
jgi:hypothetical protein